LRDVVRTHNVQTWTDAFLSAVITADHRMEPRGMEPAGMEPQLEHQAEAASPAEPSLLKALSFRTAAPKNALSFRTAAPKSEVSFRTAADREEPAFLPASPRVKRPTKDVRV
jgi:hypothetical protein